MNKQLITIYKNLTPLEKYVYDQFHNEIEYSGCEITNLSVDQIVNESYSVNKIKGGLGSLVKKGLMTNEGIDGSGYESFTVNLKLKTNNFNLAKERDGENKKINKSN